MAADPTVFPIGSRVSFLAGPTRLAVTAEVTGYDNGFLVTKDDNGKERKARAGAASAA